MKIKKEHIQQEWNVKAVVLAIIATAIYNLI